MNKMEIEHYDKPKENVAELCASCFMDDAFYNQIKGDSRARYGKLVEIFNRNSNGMKRIIIFCPNNGVKRTIIRAIY